MPGPDGALQNKAEETRRAQAQEVRGTNPLLGAAVSLLQSMGYGQGAAAVGAGGSLGAKPAPAAAPAGTPAATPAAAPTTGLTNRRYAGDAQLEAVARGQATLTSGAKGAHVRKVQAGLESLNHPLPKYHADGSYGGEMVTAVTDFQAATPVPGAAPGVIDQATMRALDLRTPQASAEVHAWRESEADTFNAGAGYRAQSDLTNPRFVGDPVLAMLISGSGAMERGTKGEYVWKIQAALRDLGFKVGVDGSYGPNTADGVAAFQEAYNVPMEAKPGQTTLTKKEDERGAVNGATMAALDAYAPKTIPTEAIPAKLKTTGGPDYKTLFADGKLEMSIAIGYDDGGLKAHRRIRTQVMDYLRREMGFSMVDPRNATAADLATVGLTPQTADKELLYFTNRFMSKAVGKEVQVVVKVLSAKDDGSDGAGRLARFRGMLENDEVVSYAGHARYGTGPDFDAHDSTAGNYVMGQGYSAEHNAELAGAENQLDKTKFSNKYQLLQLWACSTENYQPHLDKRLGKRSTPGSTQSHKDIVTTTRPVLLVQEAFASLALLRGLMAEASGATLKDMMDISQREKSSKMGGFQR